MLKAGLTTETGFCTVCDFAHARPIMLSILLVIVDVDVDVGNRVRTYVRPRPTARLRMRERCSNSADLAGFRNQLVLQLFVSGPGNVPNTARKRPSE